MASLAHLEYPNRQQVAEQSFQYTAFTIDLLARLGKWVVAPLARWTVARREAAQDRIMWEFALTDHRVMDELRVLRDRAQQGA